MGNKLTYSSILNPHNFMKMADYMPPDAFDKVLNLKVQLTEKIHGENFKVGVNEDGRRFIGQKNYDLL